jgi:hypothetical protein
MLVRRSVFEEMGGFDEVFAVAFNDVDFCIRLGQAGYRLLYTPHAELTHYESVSRGLSGYARDYQAFLPRWMNHLILGDPAYNPNLGRLQPWCPFRIPGEDEEWLSMVTGLIEKVSAVDGAGDGGLGSVPEPGSLSELELALDSASQSAVEARA